MNSIDSKTKLVAGVLIASFILTGCASFEKKFVRRKPDAPVHPVVYTQEFVKPYSNRYYYKEHFVFWRGWQKELVDGFGSNIKKERRALEEVINHLGQMANYLLPEKKILLDIKIDQLQKIQERLRTIQDRDARRDFRWEVEKIGREIEREFHYDRVADFLVSDKINLGDETPAQPAAS